MSEKQWYNQQLRILQTVLRECDLENYDAKKTIAYCKETGSNCIVVNAGGVIDMFPNTLELSNVSSMAAQSDYLPELISEAHANGIRVVARVDFRGVEQGRYHQMTHWFSQKPDGSPRVRWAGIHTPCYNSPYVGEHAERFISSILETYGFDGIWENAIGFDDGPCYCKTCRDKFRRDSGKEIPVADDYLSPVFDEYRVWKSGCADAHIRQMRDTVKKYGDDKAYMAEIFGMFHAQMAQYSGIDLYNSKNYFDFIVTPVFMDQVRQMGLAYERFTLASSSVRFLKSIMPEKRSVLLTGNNGGINRWIRNPEIDSRVWMWEAVSVGGDLWNCMFNGQHPAATMDLRNAYIETETYRFMKEHEDTLRLQTPVADVGIFYSKETRNRLSKDADLEDHYGVHIKGVEEVMADHHMQYRFIPDLNLSYETIKDLKALVLPNTAYLSDEHIAIIKQYVENGGGLVATYKTSLFDEAGNSRNDFGLSDLFGCSFTGSYRKPHFDKISFSNLDCFQAVMQPKHPVVDFAQGKTAYLMSGEDTLVCTLTGEHHETVCCCTDFIRSQPPEYSWSNHTDSIYPSIVAGTYGKGRVVYFANETDRLAYMNAHEDYKETLYGAIDWVKQGEWTAQTNAPDSVHLNITADQDDAKAMVVSLVNTTSATRRPLRSLQPVNGLTVDVRLPGDVLDTYKILRQEGDVAVETLESSDGCAVARIKLEKITEFTSVYLKVK